MYRSRLFVALLLCAAATGATALAGQHTRSLPTAHDRAVPRYAHIFVIVEENKNDTQIIGSTNAPNLTRLARTYGNATAFFAETHPSEPNYVALIGGYTYGINDDDPFFCKPGSSPTVCPQVAKPGYVDHTIDAPSLATQLQSAGLSWKNYNESIPAPGSLIPKTTLYGSKHSGFINYKSVQIDPHRAQHIVGFGQFYADLRDGHMPAFALVIPNLCDEMHGSDASSVPADCHYDPIGALIRRGDRETGTIVRQIMASSAWRAKANAAIVITWDEDDSGSHAGCCGNNPADPANRGGGHIATIVITNHGPRHLSDPTPYSHYSLLRTIDDAFGIYHYLARSNAPGVEPMLPLFRTH